MRVFKRWFRRWKSFQAAQPQLAVCRQEVERIFGGPVTWQRAGGCGRDVVCLVARENRPVGVLRLTSTVGEGVAPSGCDGMPFVALPAAVKVEREWQAYVAGFPHGLTPQPLWRNDGALLCAYVDGIPLKRDAETGRSAYLALATAALPHIARLHRAGLTHMDMSLSNILCDTAQRHLFVDFEYGPAEGLTIDQQRLYDYLRLLESIWKYLAPEVRRTVAATWGEVFRACAPMSVRAADLAPLRPALGRILGAPDLQDFFATLAVV